MIDFIRGRLAKIEPNTAVLETSGLGFKLNISLMTYRQISDRLNSEVLLYTHMIVKEDAFEMYGFSDNLEREAFLYLNKVSGVGPKVSLAILSMFDIKQLKTSILGEDVNALKAVPGIGKKTAEKIIFELKDKIKDLPVNVTVDKHSFDAMYEAREALLSLGFSPQEIQEALEAAEGSTAEEIIASALKRLSR